MKRVLCLWLPNWPIQRRQQTRSGLRGKPWGLYEASSRGGQRITHVSAAAARLGVQPGMALADGLARWGKRLCLEKHDPCADREALEALAFKLDRFSPLVGLEEAKHPESLLLDITGIAGLLGGEQVLAQEVLRAMAAEQLTGHVAIAETVGAAWAAAHFEVDAREHLIIEPGQSAAFLAGLPTAALRLSPATEGLLAELGLATIGDVMALPRSSLASRLGPEILQRLNQALGQCSEPIVALDTQVEFAVTWDLEHPVGQTKMIDAILQHLCQLLAEKLNRAGQGALELTCTLRCEMSPSVSYTVGFFQPSAGAKHFQELLHLRLERENVLGAVMGVRLEATRSSLLVPQQRELFADDLSSHQHQLSLLLNRLGGRLGRDAVTRPVLRPEAQPELAWREEPLLDPAINRRKRKTTHVPCPLGPLDRPLFLFRPPIRIATTAIAPDGPPIRFVYAGKTYRVTRPVGPERIETGWWRRRGVRRDYYRVETNVGTRFWMFRSLDSGRWYLHGEFA